VEDSVAQVKDALVALERPVADIERLVVDEQSHELAIGHVDQRLALFRIAVARLRMGQRQRFEEAVEGGAGDGVWFTLIEIAAEPDMPVRQREDRFGVSQKIEMEVALRDRSWLH
jgi:hypothetical protein